MTQRGSNLIPAELLLEAYRRMHRIRIFEERVAVLLRRGEIHGGAHTAVGQEASVVGALMAVNSDDFMTGTHRSHGHPIGKGADIGPLMAELMSRTTGICGGRGGSMHLADFKVGSLGESGIVASGMPVAVGAGLSAKLLKTGRVCVAFFGDGAANEGAAHEAMNLASVWKLPVIFLCENNGYAITTSQKTGMNVENVSARAAGYGMPGVTVDGQDFFAVYAAMTEAVERARRGEGPTLLETKTYRYHEHALGLVLNYRSDEEIEMWKGRDPLALMAGRLVADGVASEADLAAIVEAETKGVEDAVAFGRAGPKPEPDDAFNEIYANPIPMRFDDRTVGGAN